jgi:hypothetical protein
MTGNITKRSMGICRTGLLLACGLLFAFPAIAQDIQPDFPVALEKKLAARASNVDEVTLNKTMLNFASQFLHSDEKNDAEVQHLIRNLNAIYVRNYEFSEPGQYTSEDLKTIRQQFLGPNWNPMVREHSNKGKGDSDIYFKMVNNEVQGIFVLDAEPKELDMVYISGTIRPEDLEKLSGNFGIPNINVDKSASQESKGGSK